MVPGHKSRIEAFNEWAVEREWPAHCDPSLEFDASALGDLLAIWRDKAGSGVMPHRNALTARVLKPHLGNIAILERMSEEAPRYRVRLLGSRLALAIGEMQGKFLDDVLESDVVPHWEARADLALAEQCPLRFVSRVDVRRLYHLRSESLWAPLASDDGAGRLVLMAAILTCNTTMSAGQALELCRMA